MRPAGQPPGAGAACPGRAGYAPRGELDESRRGRPPRTGPSSAPAAQGQPPVMRPAGQPPGAGAAGPNGRAGYAPRGELDESRRGRPPRTGPSSAPAAQGQPPVMRPAGQPPGAGAAALMGRATRREASWTSRAAAGRPVQAPRQPRQRSRCRQMRGCPTRDGISSRGRRGRSRRRSTTLMVTICVPIRSALPRSLI